MFGKKYIQRQEEDKHKTGARDRIYFVDRSPFSAVFYAKRNGHLLEPAIREQFRELACLADIHIYSVCIRVERELLWDRIQQRLAREPGRLKFNEGSREWMEKTLAVRAAPLAGEIGDQFKLVPSHESLTNQFYETMRWDFQIENDVYTISELAHKLLQQLCGDVTGFKESYKNGAALKATHSNEESPHASPVKVCR